MANFDVETELMDRGVWPVAGIDEAGRGPLAGPVCAAAVILDPRAIPKGLNDSKALTARTRETLYEDILRSALAVSTTFSCAKTIDRINIRMATHDAMRRALHALAIPVSHALIDGNDLPVNLRCPARTIVKGDASSFSIAAASIIAKVTRDRSMARIDANFPKYGFLANSGYGTAMHMRALVEHGPCIHHRVTFAPVRDAIARFATI